jgi:hypothetical protein
MELELTVEDYSASNGRYGINLVLDTDIDTVMRNFKLEQIIEYYGDDKVLDLIGEDRVKEYFDLTEKE